MPDLGRSTGRGGDPIVRGNGAAFLVVSRFWARLVYYYYYCVFSDGEAACTRAHAAYRSRTEEVEVGGGLPPQQGASIIKLGPTRSRKDTRAHASWS